MTSKAFAPWVEPIAAGLADGRQQVIEFARSLAADAWSRPSAADGWTNKDVLAHLAGDTGKVSLAVLRAAAGGRTLEHSGLADGGDALNARDVDERRDRSVDELMAEIEGDGREWQDLLSQLKETHQHLRWPGFPLSLGEYLLILLPHDREHLAQLRTALG